VSSGANTFGRKALDASPLELIGLERSEGKTELFRDIDQLIGDIAIRTLRGARLVSLSWNASRSAAVSLIGVEGDLRDTLQKAYALDQQQARGAWFVPEEVRVQTGVINFPSYLREYPRYATGIALERIS
jgi:hypothetical protein